MSLPPGFRFHPTDVELVMYYLKRKALGKKLLLEAIAEVNIYKYSPWDLPDKSCLKNKDLEWFFFCPVARKYASGARSNRATETGYWKSTGKDRTIVHKDRTVGTVKTLVFHLGLAPKGERTDWVIHEYRILDAELAENGVAQAPYVLLKLFKKNGIGPKIGAQYGAPFDEKEWEMDDPKDSEVSAQNLLQPSKSLPLPAVELTIDDKYQDRVSAQTFQAPSESLPLPAVEWTIDDKNEDGVSAQTFQAPSESLPLPAVEWTIDDKNEDGVSAQTFQAPSESLPLPAVEWTIDDKNEDGVSAQTFQAPTVASNNLPPDFDALFDIFSDDADVGQFHGDGFMEFDDTFIGLGNLEDWEEVSRTLG